MIRYYKEFHWGGKGMSLKASDKKLFTKHTSKWKKVSDLDLVITIKKYKIH